MSANEDSLMEDNNQDIVESCKYQWTSQTTKLLVEEVRDHLSLLNNKNYMQEKLWKTIASNFNKRGYNVTDEQCSTKWKNLKRNYKSIRDNNNKTGQAKQSWEYFDIIDSFLNNQPEIAPISIASSTHRFRITQANSDVEVEECNDENDSTPCNMNDVRRKIRKRESYSGSSWMQKLYKQRKRFNKKNIKMQERFLKLFEKYIQKDNTQ